MLLNPPNMCILESAKTMRVFVEFYRAVRISESMKDYGILYLNGEFCSELEVSEDSVKEKEVSKTSTYFPSLPAIRPIARLLWSPSNVFTSLISNVSM